MKKLLGPICILVGTCAVGCGMLCVVGGIETQNLHAIGWGIIGCMIGALAIDAGILSR